MKEEYVHAMHPRVFGYGKTASAMFIDDFSGDTMCSIPV